MHTRSVVRIAAKGLIVGAGALVGAVAVTAWTGPTASPPNGNVSAPINVGTASQVKSGALGVNSLAVYGNVQIDGTITTPEGTIRDDAGGWVRTYGATGWYSQTYGGGWYMTDTSWLRAYNGKGVYTSGNIQAGTKFLTADGNVTAPSYTFINDPDTGLFNYNTQLISTVNGSQKLVLTDDVIELRNIDTIRAYAYIAAYNGMVSYNDIVMADGAHVLVTIMASGNGNFVCYNPSSDKLRQQSASCATSDARLKDHIAPIQAGLAKILKLNPVTFEWKDKEVGGEGTKLGLIAQEVKEVFPEIVTGTGTGVDGDWYGVDYGALTAPIIKAIQELKAENDDLRAELKELRALVERN